MVCSPFLPHVYEPAAGFTFRKCCDLAADPEKLTAKEQSAKVTVKFNDGSNKSFTFTVKLQA